MNENIRLINIIHEGDHYAGYLNGKFACSGDTINEVKDSLIEMMRERLES